MIATHKNNLVARCKEIGYTLAEVMPCVVAQNEDQWTIGLPRLGTYFDQKPI